MRVTKLISIILSAGFLLSWSCSSLPEDFKAVNEYPPIFPDIIGVTVPVNIAPLNFRMDGSSERTMTIFEGKSNTLKITGRGEIIIPIKKWHKLLEEDPDGSLLVTVYNKQKNQWIKYLPFRIEIKKNHIDPYLVYRRIAPGYQYWSEMGIYQRNIASFNEEPIIDNLMLPRNCMNCHSFNQNNPDQMIFHMRNPVGGTMLINNGNITRLDTKTNETISNCIYPYWHPSGKYIAFSVNSIFQVFHTVEEKRIEVMDTKSDLVVYDIQSNKLITSKVISSEDSFETFPTFSADGKILIFCSAKKGTMPEEYNKIKYNLCKISFDANTGTFGDQVDTLVSSYKTGKSISFPRTSGDGKFLMFTMSDYGNFSIWHKESDLYILDLNDFSIKPVSNANSDNTESYHSWSSDSRWFVFSSRRIDGLYTRPYIAWLNENGESSKPFLLPQKDPDYYDDCLQSFNIPEFVTGKVKTSGRNILKHIGADSKNVTFELKD